MIESEVFSVVEQHYQEYGHRAKCLRNSGVRIVGYFCSLTPIELITAAGLMPFRLRGDVREQVTEGDIELETIACPFVRSCFDLTSKGRYDFCDALVVPHACDSITKTYPVWRYSMGKAPCHFVNLPHKATNASMRFFANELGTFKKWLEQICNKSISDDALSEAVRLYDENRKKVRLLYELRKSVPPLISGGAINKLLVAGMGLPVSEASRMLDDVLESATRPSKKPLRGRPRILVSGPCLDYGWLIDLIEDAGGDVVIDDLCIGTRDCWREAKVGGGILETIADLYLRQINCSRTCKEDKEECFRSGTESRFHELEVFINEYKVHGVILFTYKSCDPFGFDVPAKMAFFSSINIPAHFIEVDYSSGDVDRIRTRIQAFLEMIG